MPEPISKFFKGLTTQHVGVVWILCGLIFWVAEIKPRVQAAESAHQGLTSEVSRIADTLDGFRKEVVDIRTEVKVHGVLIATMSELKTDMKELRRELNEASIRNTSYKNP